MRPKTITCCLTLLALLAISLFKSPTGRAVPEIRYYYRDGELHHQIRSYLSSMKELHGEEKQSLSADLTKIIIVSQPQSGDFLLSIIAQPNNTLRRRAINAFIQTWNTMNLHQIDGFIRRGIDLKVDHREAYPEKAGGAIGVSYSSVDGWGGWPSNSKINLKTKTSFYVDGKLMGEPFSYDGPMAATGTAYTGGLKRGDHTILVRFEYEFTYQGVLCRGYKLSKEFHFKIVKDSGDPLKSTTDAALDAKVKAAFYTAETNEALKSQLAPGLFFEYSDGTHGMEPQSTVRNTVTGLQTALHCPVWAINPGLPVDMIFDVTIEDMTTGKKFMGNSIRVPKNTTRFDRFEPYLPAQFAAGRTGTIPIIVTLKPSRRQALAYPWVTKYYPKSLTFTGLSITLVTTQGKPDKKPE